MGHVVSIEGTTENLGSDTIEPIAVGPSPSFL